MTTLPLCESWSGLVRKLRLGGGSPQALKFPPLLKNKFQSQQSLTMAENVMIKKIPKSLDFPITLQNVENGRRRLTKAEDLPINKIPNPTLVPLEFPIILRNVENGRLEFVHFNYLWFFRLTIGISAKLSTIKIVQFPSSWDYD